MKTRYGSSLIKLLLLWLVFARVGFATNAGGIVGAGAVWRLADSPIYVTSDVQIPSGVTLTIEPGVHVVFTGAYQILVQGAVSAAGTAGAPITFGPLTAGTNCGATVLKFEGTDLALSSLAHIKVEGVKYAIRIGEEDEDDQGGKNTGTLTVGGMTASDAGILTDGYETGASLLIKDIDFDGVDVVGNYPRSEAITLDGGFFLDGTINSGSYNHGIALKSLALVNASVKMGCCGANVTLDGCDVLDSSFSDYNDDYSVTIRSSLVRSTSVDLGQAASVVIADSMFVFDGGPGIVARNLQMSHSSVWGAHGALTLLGSGNAVEDCTFCDNDGVIVYASQASGAVSGSNLLLNAGLSLDNRSAAGIAAAGNFWGVGTAAAIEALVRHHNDDINFGLAGFSPFLLSPNPGAPISRPAHSVKTNVGGGVHVEWDANPESDVAGYRLHFHPDGTGGYADSVDVDNVTSCTLGGLTAADTIAITAYDAQADGTDDWVEGHESWHAVVNDPAPEIAVTPASLDFSVAAVGTTATLSLAVENPGTGTLTVSAITSSKAAFSASPAAFTVAPGASRTVAVTFAPASIGAQSATLSIASDAGAAKTVALSGFGAPSSGSGAGGIVGAGAVWRLADSPIYVTSDVQIPSGVTLTIEPGVHVVFTGAYQILVQGAVSAAGTAGAPITFGPLTAGTNCGATVLKFEGTDLALSSLAHIKVEGVKYAIRIGEEDEDDQGGKNTGTLTVGGMTASDAGILTDGYETGASLLIKDIDFDGVDVVGNYPRSEAITLDGGFFLDGTINSDSYNHGIALKSLALVNASVKMGCCGANVTLDGCDVLDSSFSDYNDDYSVTIRSSLVRSTSVDLGQAASVVIADSMFVFDGGPGIVARNLQMSHSSVWGAHGALTLLGSGNAVEDCTFCDNDGVIVYASQASGAVSGSNLLLNAGLSLDNRSAAGIAAAGNFWGVGTAAAIEALVRHHNDDINFGLAGFSPFLLSPNPGAPISRPLVVQQVINDDLSRDLYWSRGLEADVAGYRVHYSTDDSIDSIYHSVNAGDLTHLVTNPSSAIDMLAVTAYDNDANGVNDQAEGHESWYTFAETVKTPDWFKLRLQPKLSSDGMISNVARQYCPVRVLSWTLPPAVYPGQSVDSIIRVEYSDDNMPSGNYDRASLISASVYGDWAVESAQATLVAGEAIGAPRIVEFPFTFTAPEDSGKKTLRYALASNASSAGSGFDIANYYGQDSASGVGPYCEATFEVLPPDAPPLSPTHLEASSGAQSVLLTWKPNTESNLKNYCIYRSLEDDSGTADRIDTIAMNDCRYLDENVEINKTYYYWITAINALDKESGFSNRASATPGEIVMSIDDYHGAPGDEVHLMVSAENAAGVSGNGLDVVLTYDTRLLTPLTVSTTALTHNFTLASNASADTGQINITGVALNGALIQGRGALLDVSFTVKDGLEPGESGNHAFVQVKMYNSALNSLAVDYSDQAVFTVSESYVLGDVNGDGEIDSLDALMALQHAAGLRTLRTSPPEFQAADINKDGVVDAADVTLILQMAVGLRSSMLAKMSRQKASAHLSGSSPHIQLYVPAVAAMPGKTIEVPLYFSGETGFSGLDLSLIYDPRVLKLQSVARGDFCADFSLNSDMMQGAPSITLSRVANIGAGKGVVAVFKFLVIGQLGEQSPLNISRRKFSGENGENLDYASDIATTNGLFYLGANIFNAADDWMNYR